MRVLQINFFLDSRRTPTEILRDWQSLTDIAVAARAGGADVHVVQACVADDMRVVQGVDFHFVKRPRSKPLAAAAAFSTLLDRLQPDVAHVHGLNFATEVLALRALAPQLPVLLQDHANGLPRFWRRRGFSRGLAAAAAVSFCSREQAGPFHAAGLLTRHIPVHESPESTSTFTPGDRQVARTGSGIQGEPALLWVGHLDSNKDPLVVLEAVSAVSRELPGLQLWCCYGSAPLRAAVETRIARDTRLRDRVHLLGRISHDRVQELMRAADLFVLGSHREGGNFSTIEAMATGLTPVVTDIPSQRALTGNGAVGELWPPGNARECAAALLRATARLDSGSRAAVRAHFDAALSHAAIGRRLSHVYASVAGRSLPRASVA